MWFVFTFSLCRSTIKGFLNNAHKIVINQYFQYKTTKISKPFLSDQEKESLVWYDINLYNLDFTFDLRLNINPLMNYRNFYTFNSSYLIFFTTLNTFIERQKLSHHLIFQNFKHKFRNKLLRITKDYRHISVEFQHLQVLPPSNHDCS